MFPPIPNTREDRGNIYVYDGLRDTFSNGNVVAFEEWGKDVILDYLEYGTNDSSIYPCLHVNEAPEGNDWDDNIFHTINSDTTRWKATAARLAYDGHSNLMVHEYNTNDDKYKFILKAPIICPGGARLVFKYDGTAPETAEITSKAVYRVL